MRILVIEDNQDIAANLGDYLEDRGHTVDFAADGVTGLHLAVVHDFDAIVLDLNLPGMDGLEVCRKLRNEARKQTPVLMLTARDTLDNKLAGFDSGADDYLIKPFALQEVEVRLNALARRGKGVQTRVLDVADLEYNLDTLEVRREGKLLQLNPTALKILQALMEASPAVVTRQELETRVWGEELPDSDSLRVHIHGLRAVVDKPFDPPLHPDATRHRLPHRRARCRTPEGSTPARKATRYRRRLRSRIILSFVLLGFGLTALFAFATNWTRVRVENDLVEEVMNSNIEQAARQFEDNPRQSCVPRRPDPRLRLPAGQVRVGADQSPRMVCVARRHPRPERHGRGRQSLRLQAGRAQDAEGLVLPRLRHDPVAAQRTAVQSRDLQLGDRVHPAVAGDRLVGGVARDEPGVGTRQPPAHLRRRHATRRRWPRIFPTTKSASSPRRSTTTHAA